MTATWYSRYRPCFLEAIAARAANRVIDILRGAQTEKIGRFGHDRLPTLGVGADRGKNEWRSLVRQMVATGYRCKPLEASSRNNTGAAEVSIEMTAP